MSKVEHPEPAAHMYPSDLKTFEFGEHIRSAFSIAVGRSDTGEKSAPLYTADQMESYAAAKVQEMLHEEAKPDNIKRAEYYGEGYADGWKAALESLAAIAKKNYLAALAGRVDVDEDDDDDRNMEIFNVGQVAQALAYSKMEGAIRALLTSTPA